MTNGVFMYRCCAIIEFNEEEMDRFNIDDKYKYELVKKKNKR